ncbi:flagellar type III secretion system protein FlhB [Roseovarius sp. LXJ103]|uniref:EscU/YscU/HrcU family type III secretion system export apparatus switch protein n=1 Tax=Roseovarius carneus TaxID=2853164 RepID=UPI000D60FBEE|nr:flagellar type III secretion system protein FlhB [Roseovarius carneus]MBZ8117543.1 flagellar type III secretion system protein FlhB [Roseovarius carneus]PWE36662.1 flagellar biosynthesis protein FlhB [Pelagicola sp. LXJ1103]
MSGQDDDADKTHEPTQHKLDEARKKGELVRSADVTTAAAYLGFLITGVVAGTQSVTSISNSMMVLFDQSDNLAPLIFGGHATATIGGLLGALALGLLVWFVLPGAMAMLAVLAQRSLVFAPTKLAFKASRINPIENAKNKYGLSGLFEFGKSLLKLLVYSVVLGVYLKVRLPEMAGSLHAEPRGIGALMAQVLVEFMIVVCIIAFSIGALDYMWQRFDHFRKNRMSHKDLRDEAKQQEGDPYMKQERRARATQIASEQMMAEVPKADVVIMNPTHFAVALKWSRAPGAAPECVAKGMDHIALAIRDLAMEHGVPVRQDPPTARALYSATEIGQEINPDHYRAVAAAIRFAETMRRRAGARK